MTTAIERAWELKQALVDFVLEAEGDLAAALESYVASELKRHTIPQDFAVDRFVIGGRVGTKTPIDLFMEHRPDLEEGDRSLLNSWHRTFTGLFVVEQALPDEIEFMNWLTAKHYLVKLSHAQAASEIAARLKPGEIVLTRISPITDTDWMISTSYTVLGKLGKPKLAVAIGNFKENHKSFLYADAPELLAEAWKSVGKYHQIFLDFFGSDEVTLPGYQLNQKLGDFQALLAQRFLAEAGIDESKSLEDLAAEAGLDEAQLTAVAQEAGVDATTVTQLFAKKDGSTSVSKMVAPKVQIPDQLKKTEQVTVLAHPQWGQMFLPSHHKFKSLLEAPDASSVAGAEKLVRHYLEDSTINLFVWQRLADQYPQSLEQVIQGVLDRPNFTLSTDLTPLLQEFGKPLTPELPEIASVPIHLHNLFEEAMQEVNKSKPKGKEKPKKTGFANSR